MYLWTVFARTNNKQQTRTNQPDCQSTLNFIRNFDAALLDHSWLLIVVGEASSPGFPRRVGEIPIKILRCIEALFDVYIKSSTAGSPLTLVGSSSCTRRHAVPSKDPMIFRSSVGFQEFLFGILAHSRQSTHLLWQRGNGRMTKIGC